MRKFLVGNRYICSLLGIPFIFTVASAKISITYNFDTPNIKIPKAFGTPHLSLASGRNYCRIELAGLPNIQQAGKPALPFKAVRILLPSNEKIANIKVTKGGKTFLGNSFIVEPGRLLFPLRRSPIYCAPTNNKKIVLTK